MLQVSIEDLVVINPGAILSSFAISTISVVNVVA